MAAEIGIDMGSTSTSVYVKGKGVVLKEPSVIAFDRDSKELRAVGEEAQQIFERAAGTVIAVYPLKNGVISNYTLTEKLISHFIQKALGKPLLKKPRLCICVPSRATEIERMAVAGAAEAIGVREVQLVEAPIAAALGAGLDISKPYGTMIVDIGGGSADIAVISLSSIVTSISLKTAGDDFDDAIVRYMRDAHDLLIGHRTAEDIKIKIGTAYPFVEEAFMEVWGRNLTDGLLRHIMVSSTEIEKALQESVYQIVGAIFSVMEQTTAELCADILERGIILTGGGALLNGLEELIEEKTGVTTVTAEDAAKAVVLGTGRFVEVIRFL